MCVYECRAIRVSRCSRYKCVYKCIYILVCHCMYGIYIGNGWEFAKFAIVDTTASRFPAHIVDDAYDSLCFGSQDVRYYCVYDGT